MCVLCLCLSRVDCLVYFIESVCLSVQRRLSFFFSCFLESMFVSVCLCLSKVVCLFFFNSVFVAVCLSGPRRFIQNKNKEAQLFNLSSNINLTSSTNMRIAGRQSAVASEERSTMMMSFICSWQKQDHGYKYRNDQLINTNYRTARRGCLRRASSQKLAIKASAFRVEPPVGREECWGGGERERAWAMQNSDLGAQTMFTSLARSLAFAFSLSCSLALSVLLKLSSTGPKTCRERRHTRTRQ